VPLVRIPGHGTLPINCKSLVCKLALIIILLREFAQAAAGALCWLRMVLVVLVNDARLSLALEDAPVVHGLELERVALPVDAGLEKVLAATTTRLVNLLVVLFSATKEHGKVQVLTVNNALVLAAQLEALAHKSTTAFALEIIWVTVILVLDALMELAVMKMEWTALKRMLLSVLLEPSKETERCALPRIFVSLPAIRLLAELVVLAVASFRPMKPLVPLETSKVLEPTVLLIRAKDRSTERA